MIKSGGKTVSEIYNKHIIKYFSVCYLFGNVLNLRNLKCCNTNKSVNACAFCVGLTYLLQRAVSGPKTWIMLSPRFFMP